MCKLAAYGCLIACVCGGDSGGGGEGCTYADPWMFESLSCSYSFDRVDSQHTVY